MVAPSFSLQKDGSKNVSYCIKIFKKFQDVPQQLHRNTNFSLSFESISDSGITQT